VVVCAPTGSGKTLVAEAGIATALAAGKRAFYTTPLKALSNQKLREFRLRFGASLVGLKTGDASVNPEARIVVMTTEILRNMLYRSGDDDEAPALADVGLIILDEVHYLADADRGTVWEECIIYSPPTVPLLCLSATVGNPDDLQAWISQVHGPCELITSSLRPVPLNFCFCKRGDDADDAGWPGLGPLLNRRGDRLHPALVQGDASGVEARGGEGGPRMVSSWRRSTPPLDMVLRLLKRDDLLPCVLFIFSRKRCDESVTTLAQYAAGLGSEEERQRISAALAELRLASPDAVREQYVPALLCGVAAHHAGCLPAWKQMVEELFQAGVLKVVCATETLAAGINMPARSVVLSALSKRDGTGPRRLTVNEFMQMAGRAGRRGYDTRGTVVVLQSPFEGAGDAGELVLGQPEALASRFSVSYGMALNLLRSRTLGEVQQVVHASFGNFLRNLARASRGARVDNMKAELELLRRNMSPKVREAEQALKAISKLRGTLTEERRAVKLLLEQQGPGAGRGAVQAASAGQPHWLLDRPLPVAVLLRLVPGARAVAPPVEALARTPAGWGAVPPDGDSVGDDAALEDLDDEDELLFPVEGSQQARGSRVDDVLSAAAEVTLSAAIMSFDEAGPGDDSWELVALGADNVWYRGSLDLVVGLGDEWLLPPGVVQAQPPGPEMWAFSNGLFRAAGGRASFASAGRISNALVGLTEGDGLPLPADNDAAEYVAAARLRIEALERQMAAFTSDVAMQKNIRKAAARLNRMRALEEAIGRLGDRNAQAVTPAGWGDFQAAVAVLRAAGALNADDDAASEAFRLTRLGEAAAAVRAQNELWMAVALTSGVLDKLSPQSLSGALTALLSDECISRPNSYTAYNPTPEVEEALRQLAPLGQQLFETQLQNGFEAPIGLSPFFTGLVESWAAGAEWCVAVHPFPTCVFPAQQPHTRVRRAQVLSDTSLDEGDVARLLRRVSEFLGQLSDVPFISVNLRDTAKQARRLVNRAPISDAPVA
jgi:superfamily II RNA helicase